MPPSASDAARARKIIRAREWIAALSLSAFCALLAWQRLRATFAFDAPLLQWTYGQSNHVIDTASWWLARLGYGYGVLPFDAVLVAVLLLRRRIKDGVFALAAFGGSLLLNTAIKHAVARARPDLPGVAELHHSYSFPSGHAMATATLAAVVITLAWRTRWRWAVVLGSIGFAAAVGAGRVQMGVHYPSDVLAGWAAGVAWACLMHLLVMRQAKSGPSLE